MPISPVSPIHQGTTPRPCSSAAAQGVWQKAWQAASAEPKSVFQAYLPALASATAQSLPLLGVTARADGCFHLEDLRAKLPEALSEFSQRLRVALREKGISTQPPFKLQGMPDGSVGIVPASDPRSQQVSALMKEQPELRDAFVEHSCAEATLRAGDEASAFQRAYAINPKEACIRFAYLFSDYRNSHFPAFQLTVGPDGVTEGWEDGYTGII